MRENIDKWKTRNKKNIPMYRMINIETTMNGNEMTQTFSDINLFVHSLQISNAIVTINLESLNLSEFGERKN